MWENGIVFLFQVRKLKFLACNMLQFSWHKNSVVPLFWALWPWTYRQEILTSELEREKLFRFSHIAYAYVGKTE